ncbi:hypothetical protein LSAT2_010511 [Lamellibrachia satsuma]|nr:hypothetical protein LSAT2_010511 [Lamellibrachia satsuma]
MPDRHRNLAKVHHQPWGGSKNNTCPKRHPSGLYLYYNRNDVNESTNSYRTSQLRTPSQRSWVTQQVRNAPGWFG